MLQGGTSVPVQHAHRSRRGDVRAGKRIRRVRKCPTVLRAAHRACSHRRAGRSTNRCTDHARATSTATSPATTEADAQPPTLPKPAVLTKFVECTRGAHPFSGAAVHELLGEPPGQLRADTVRGRCRRPARPPGRRHGSRRRRPRPAPRPVPRSGRRRDPSSRRCSRRSPAVAPARRPRAARRRRWPRTGRDPAGRRPRPPPSPGGRQCAEQQRRRRPVPPPGRPPRGPRPGTTWCCWAGPARRSRRCRARAGAATTDEPGRPDRRGHLASEAVTRQLVARAEGPQAAVRLLARRLVGLHAARRRQEQHQPGQQVVGEPEQDAGRTPRACAQASTCARPAMRSSPSRAVHCGSPTTSVVRPR